MGICQSYKNKRKISEENVNSMEPDTNKLEKMFKTHGKLFNDKNIVYKMK